jgi:hypothetical protein
MLESVLLLCLSVMAVCYASRGTHPSQILSPGHRYPIATTTNEALQLTVNYQPPKSYRQWPHPQMGAAYLPLDHGS